MSIERLVAMANDIGNFFAGEPLPEDRIAGVANHLSRFWNARMRQQLIAYAHTQGGHELADHVREAVLRLPDPAAKV